MVISRSASVCSDKSGTSKTFQNEKPMILSRHNVPLMPGSRKLTLTSFPYRAIGTLSSIDVGKKQFGVMIKLEKSDPEALLSFLNDYYAKDEDEEVKTETKPDDQKDEVKKLYNFRRCKFVRNPQVGEIYAARIDELEQIVRVRVLEKGRSSMKNTSTANQIKVHLLDYGLVTYIAEGKTMMIAQHFIEEDYQTGLALVCQLPDARLLKSAPFPKLENFKLGDHVEVNVLSDGEPCLAVLGQLNSGPNVISRELFSYGLDTHAVGGFHRATGMLSSDTESNKGWAPSRWSHSDVWTLVTVVSCEDLANVAVRDVFTSLRFLRLQQSLNRSYKKSDFCKGMKVDGEKLRSGDPVIVYCKTLKSYIRGTVTSILHDGRGCDVEAVDIPNLTVCDAPSTMVYYPSLPLLEVPPLIFYVNLMKGYSCLTRADITKTTKEYLIPNTVAVLKFSLDENSAQLETYLHKKGKVNENIEDYLATLSADEEECEDDDQSLVDGVSTLDDGISTLADGISSTSLNEVSLACCRSQISSRFSVRFVSSKYIRPHPRSYRRRLYEAAIAPILPETPRECHLAEVLERLNRQKTDYADIELAEVKEIKRWIREHQFRVMVVCQLLSVNGRTLWLTSNQLRLNGLELRKIDNKIAKKLFEKTPLDSLEPLWCGENVFLFGKDIDVIKAIVTQTKKTNFLIPLGKILPMKEIEKLAELSDLEAVRAQTAAILDQIPIQITQALGYHGEQLSALLGQISSTNAGTPNN
uniref:Uncharacterized protein n=1 Tax=Panagrolaimus sp. ES5 TaxID=591445 RepID=A0AC34GNX7_9BILA